MEVEGRLGRGELSALSRVPSLGSEDTLLDIPVGFAWWQYLLGFCLPFCFGGGGFVAIGGLQKLAVGAFYPPHESTSSRPNSAK